MLSEIKSTEDPSRRDSRPVLRTRSSVFRVSWVCESSHISLPESPLLVSFSKTAIYYGNTKFSYTQDNAIHLSTCARLAWTMELRWSTKPLSRYFRAPLSRATEDAPPSPEDEGASASMRTSTPHTAGMLARDCPC